MPRLPAGARRRARLPPARRPVRARDLNPDRDEAQIADLPRLLAVLDRLTRSGRIGAPGRRFDLYLTEFAYQTSPPDHAVGVTLGQQTRYLQQSAYIAWRNPRVRNLTQYQWRDEPVSRAAAGAQEGYARWQSGLLFVTGRPKPALSASPAVRRRSRPARRSPAPLGPGAARAAPARCGSSAVPPGHRMP